MYPYIFDLGGFRLASYGVLAALGYAAGLFYVLKRRSATGLDAETLWNLAAVVIGGALLGGKVLYVLLSWTGVQGAGAEKLLYFAKDIRYGFVFYGGVAGAVAGAWWYSRRKGFRLLPAADVFAPALALGHAFGRVGCFLAGCCHGRPSGSWGVVFSNPECLVDKILLGLPLYPVQLLEAAANLLIFLLLHFLSSGRVFRRHGQALLLYCILYSMARFGLEFMRGDDRGAVLLGFSPSQWIAGLALVAAAAAWRFLPEKDSQNA